MSVEKGDVVVLNSGGMKMTAESISDDLVNCVWFDAKNVLQRASFETAVLTTLPKLSQAEIAKLISAAI